MGIITMSGALKKLLVVLMALLLVFSFAACGKDDVDSRNPSSTLDPTQDYDDEWGEMSGLTSSELEDVESLWNDNKGDAEIVTPDSSSSEETSSSETPLNSTLQRCSITLLLQSSMTKTETNSPNIPEPRMSTG